MSLAEHPLRRLAKGQLARRFPASFGPRRQRRVADEYRVSRVLLDENGAVPLTWWVNAVNFGDVMSPWLIGRMTGRRVVLAQRGQRSYVAIGSVVKRARAGSLVWGAGAFGVEPRDELSARARYRAVRGPLTRALLRHHGIDCPEVYGDPALLAPLYYFPDVPVASEVGLVVRWSERDWADVAGRLPAGVRLIDLATDDVEGVIDAMLGCRRIVSSSLHGLIVADAYGIPSAWLASDTPKGRDFKFYDYFLSVDKVRRPTAHDVATQPLDVRTLLSAFSFDARPISFSYRALLGACPFLSRIPQDERGRRDDATAAAAADPPVQVLAAPSPAHQQALGLRRDGTPATTPPLGPEPLPVTEPVLVSAS